MFEKRKLIAILRGLQPEQAVEAAAIIMESGIEWLEVPTNSPSYAKSIKRIIQAFPKAMIGVGTVLTTEHVRASKEAGAKFIVSPNTVQKVIEETKKLNLISIPGFQTPSEAFVALNAGADILKFFPSNWVGFKAIRDIRAVLPPNTLVFAVGGVRVENYREVLTPLGVAFDGIGIGSDLFKAGQNMDNLKKKALSIVDHYDQVMAEAKNDFQNEN